MFIYSPFVPLPALGSIHNTACSCPGTGDYFDLLNACFTSTRPQLHSSYINPEEAGRLRQLMRMNYETMHLFGMSRAERTRCLTIMNYYYRLHLPDFPALKSLDVLKELFD